MGVLCVIDMQPEFEAATNSELVRKVIDEIKVSMRKKEHILIVRYKGCGKVDQSIWDTVEGYQFVHYITKNDDDGSPEIVEAMKNFTLISKETIKVCGVNTWECVKSTYAGLAYKLPHSIIVVLEDVCGGCYYNIRASLTEHYTKKRLNCENDKVPPHNMRSRKRRKTIVVI